MKILWESNDWSGAVVDPAVTCLDWIPTFGETTTGLLAAGSESGAVGVTFTELNSSEDDLKRYNFNLRGHHSAISIVAWNRMQNKLASCDLSGIIYVWVPNGERWSVELVNERGIKVRDVSWSPSGTSALICYEDNFVLIGSSTGQRIWSSSFAVVVSCGVWAPDSRELILGLSSGSIQVLTEQGATVTEKMLSTYPIKQLSASPLRPNGKWTLAACTSANLVLLLNSYDEIDPANWQSVDKVLLMRWNSNGTLLAILCSPNRLVLLDFTGNIVHSQRVPMKTSASLCALTWAHNEELVISAADGHLAVGRVLVGVPSLVQLVSYSVWLSMGSTATCADLLPIPPREQKSIRSLDHHIIRCRIPSVAELCSQVCQPSEWQWYCTVRPVPHKAHSYVLCMEHMGGLVPILMGRQTNRIIPQFIISLLSSSTPSSPSQSVCSDNGSSAQVEDAGAFIRPSLSRNSVWRRSKRHLRALMNRHVAIRQPPSRSNDKLLQVTSNVWCTRFKMTSLATDILPSFLAQVIYKTSVLHLQPRQMTVQLTDLAKRSGSPSSLSRSPVLRSSLRKNSSDVISDHLCLAEDSSRSIVVAPSDRELFMLRGAAAEAQAEDGTGTTDDDSDEGISPGEHQLYQNVFSEFNDLRLAVENHIARMKNFAADLENSSHRLEPINRNEASYLSSCCRFTSKCMASPKETRSGSAGRSSTRSEMMPASSSTPIVPPNTYGSSAPVLHWNHQLDDIEYIDDDDSVVLRTANCDRTPLVDSSKRIYDSWKKGLRQLNDITSVLDKLSKLANDLTTRCSVGQLQNDPLPSTSHSSPEELRLLSVDSYENYATVSSIRLQLKDIARKVAQIEKKIDYGDELLDEVCGDLQQRIQHLKAVLGEQHSNPVEELNMLTMQNKAPFWNEASQVYQLDFGGRVTQESAKNFQIEHNKVQVMQFGRIENGAYTLDFRSPFSAIQAFAVALASITQRLK